MCLVIRELSELDEVDICVGGGDGELLESDEADICVGGGDGVIGDNEEDAVQFPLLHVWSGVDEEGVRRDRVQLRMRHNMCNMC